jgi:integrase
MTKAMDELCVNTIHTWGEWFAAAREHRKLDGLRAHELRHTLGTRLANAGAPIAVIGQAGRFL